MNVSHPHKKGVQAMIQYPEEYIDYLVYFHGDRDYFECHEVLEEYWKEHPQSELRHAWVGLIQVAVGVYHHRRNNIAGAQKMLSSAITKLSEQDLLKLGIEADKFQNMVKKRVASLNENPAIRYEDFNIPIQDEQLLQLCMERCAQKQVKWGQPSDLSDDGLIHKHSLRDRSDVIAMRQDQLVEKQRRRENK